MVARWSINWPIWNLTTFPTHLIRQTWVRATFGYLYFWNRKSRIGFFRRLKKLWPLFIGSGTSWPWTTCNSSSLIGMNNLDGSVSMKENVTQIDIKTLSESLSHGEIEGVGNFFPPYIKESRCDSGRRRSAAYCPWTLYLFFACTSSRSTVYRSGDDEIEEFLNFVKEMLEFSLLARIITTFPMMLWHCSRSSSCATSRVDSQRWDCGEHAVAALLRWCIEDLIVIRLLRYVWCERVRMIYRKTQWRILYMWQIAEGRRLRSNGHWHKERRRQRTDWTMSRSC
jgi:hypothetical protein